MMQETPTITASAYSSNAFDLNQALGINQLQNHAWNPLEQQKNALLQNQFMQLAGKQAVQPQEAKVSARIVKVFIADPNENIPLDQRVLYTGDEKLTDLTDQELYFEVPIAELLAKHNTLRATVIDKKQAEKFGRDIFLEAARIRDLKMVVVTVASF